MSVRETPISKSPEFINLVIQHSLSEGLRFLPAHHPLETQLSPKNRELLLNEVIGQGRKLTYFKNLKNYVCPDSLRSKYGPPPETKIVVKTSAPISYKVNPSEFAQEVEKVMPRLKE